jgi:large subunit ribosomal protein L17
MRHRKYTFKIGRTSAHRRSLMANAVCSLIEHGRITTTLAKAKEIRRQADKMVTLGKVGTLHARRQAIAELHQVDKVAKLFSDIAPGFQERQGGYTRMMKLGPRVGDAAEMCILEFVESDAQAKASKQSFDATADASADATVDASADATVEATAEATVEATAEAPAEATAEAPAEATAEATADASVETPAEVSADEAETPTAAAEEAAQS